MSRARAAELVQATAPAPDEADAAAHADAPLVLGPEPVVATCRAEQHPTLRGRVLCQVERGERTLEAWVPCLLHVVPREGDRVLLQRPANAPEPIVVGVIDGYRPRAEPAARVEHVRALQPDEVVRLTSHRGEPLLELRDGPDGAVVRLLSPSVTLDGGESLAIEADAVRVRARQGGVEISASEDVVVQGEAIHLN